MVERMWVRYREIPIIANLPQRGNLALRPSRFYGLFKTTRLIGEAYRDKAAVGYFGQTFPNTADADKIFYRGIMCAKIVVTNWPINSKAVY